MHVQRHTAYRPTYGSSTCRSHSYMLGHLSRWCSRVPLGLQNPTAAAPVFSALPAVWQVRASAQTAPGTVTLTRPVEPGPEDCCQSGCVRCVWDIYADELQAYQAATKAAPSAAGGSTAAAVAAGQQQPPPAAQQPPSAGDTVAGSSQAGVVAAQQQQQQQQQLDPLRAGLDAFAALERQLASQQPQQQQQLQQTAQQQ